MVEKVTQSNRLDVSSMFTISMHASKCRRADYVKVCLLTLLLLTIGAYFSYSVSQNNAKTVFKIVKSLCELHAELQTPCCPQGQDTYSIKSWFDCILRNSTDPVASERFPSTDSTKLNPNYRDWVDRKAPAYRMPQYYYEIRADHHSGNRSCPVEMDLRETNYHLLRYWIELTKKNKIVWWITFGTLLGAIRWVWVRMMTNQVTRIPLWIGLHWLHRKHCGLYLKYLRTQCWHLVTIINVTHAFFTRFGYRLIFNEKKNKNYASSRFILYKTVRLSCKH